METLAASLGIEPEDIIVDGLTAARRALQDDEAWRARDGYGVQASLTFTVRPGARAGAMYALELDLNDPGSPIAREISWRTSSEYCTDGIYRRVSYVDAAPRRLQQ